MCCLTAFVEFPGPGLQRALRTVRRLSTAGAGAERRVSNAAVEPEAFMDKLMFDEDAQDRRCGQFWSKLGRVGRTWVVPNSLQKSDQGVFGALLWRPGCSFLPRILSPADFGHTKRGHDLDEFCRLGPIWPDLFPKVGMVSVSGMISE